MSNFALKLPTEHWRHQHSKRLNAKLRNCHVEVFALKLSLQWGLKQKGRENENKTYLLHGVAPAPHPGRVPPDRVVRLHFLTQSH